MITTTPIQDMQPENAREFFKGMWHGIAMGCVIGGAIVLVLLKA